MQLREFMALPTADRWQWALNHGWPGPDGSSSSTDHIMGVRIGVTSALHDDAFLPANLHDWRYFLGRLVGLPETHRAAADEAYRDGCLKRVRAKLTGWRLAIAITRCHGRYVALRVGARFAWTQAQRVRNFQWEKVVA